VVSLLLLARELVASAPEFDVWLQFVVNEEVDGAGTRDSLAWFVEEGWLGRYTSIGAVLVEPTDLCEIKIAHKGNVFVKLVVRGDSGHGSAPEKIKTNAVLEMFKVLVAVEAMAEKWKVDYQDGLLGYPSVAVGTSIQGGSVESVNKFADRCVATLDVRTVPEMHDQVLGLVRECLVDYPVEVEYLHEPAGFGFTSQDHWLVASFTSVVTNSRVVVARASNDQCFFTAQQIPAVVFGPGIHRCIHKPNEWCEVAKIDQAVEIFTKLIKKV